MPFIAIPPVNFVPQVGTVTVAVPQLSRDLFYWPGITGEQFAPTFGAGASYQQAAGVPAWQVGTGSITFPQTPRRGPNGEGHVHVKFLLYLASGHAFTNTAGGDPVFLWGFGGSSGSGGVWIQGQGPTNTLTFHTEGATGNTSTAIGTLAVDTWHTVEIDIAADGTTTLTIDGAQLAQIAGGGTTWTPTTPTPLGIAPKFPANSYNALYAAQLQFTWPAA